MKYEIKVCYRTGNSFNSEDREETLDIEWSNLNRAKKNLKAIRNHWEMYEAIENISRYSSNRLNEIQLLLVKFKDNWWFVSDKKHAIKQGKSYNVITEKDFNKMPVEDRIMVYDTTMAQNCMKLQMDNGNYMQQWNPWCGYFEELYSVEIINADNDLKFDLRN